MALGPATSESCTWKIRGVRHLMIIRSTIGPLIIGDKAPDENFQNPVNMSGHKFHVLAQYVRTKSGIWRIFKFCSDAPSGLQKSVRISQKKKNYFTYFTKCYVRKKSLSTYPVSISCPTSTFLANCYHSFDCHQYILKFSPQLIEDLEVFVIEGERSAILTECGCYSQGAEELIRWKKDLRAHV